jgi:AcrR family transcriptional regulator
MTKRRVTHVDRGATERVRKAAIDLFRARGYHGTPIRAVASVVKIKAGSLYYHLPSKQQILYENFEKTMNDCLDGLRAACESSSDPRQRLRAAVRFHVLFHIERKDDAKLDR